jgi:hypothetical protein
MFGPVKATFKKQSSYRTQPIAHASALGDFFSYLKISGDM